MGAHGAQRRVGENNERRHARALCEFQTQFLQALEQRHIRGQCRRALVGAGCLPGHAQRDGAAVFQKFQRGRPQRKRGILPRCLFQITRGRKVVEDRAQPRGGNTAQAAIAVGTLQPVAQHALALAAAQCVDDSGRAQRVAQVPQEQEDDAGLAAHVYLFRLRAAHRAVVAVFGRVLAEIAQQIRPQAAAGIKALNEGFDTLTANDKKLTSGAKNLKAAGKQITSALPQVKSGAGQLADGSETLTAGIKTYTDGVAKLAANSSALTSGTSQLSNGAKTLSSGATTLANGTKTLASGTTTLYTGTKKLVSNNSTLNSGAKQLADGASQIQSGSSQLYDGSKKLGNGVKELKDGSETLTTSLSDGAKTVKDNSASDETIKMFATPVVSDETKLTDVPNNGHAMAPYMMSVGLWVGALAFCLMYPLAQYKGKLKSGFAWWASKASVLYPVAILQGICLILLLRAFNGFTPAEMGKTVLFACLTSMTFTSIMYFFNITFGKVGSFLMLVFMVVQLAGSAGTYPVEISPEFVSKIHAYLPFTYTVDAFRATISGGRSITTSVIVLAVLFVIFTILTILQFNHMTKRKKAEKVVLFDWLEERGLA